MPRAFPHAPTSCRAVNFINREGVFAAESARDRAGILISFGRSRTLCGE
jgi:hypothetical protein